MFLRSYKISRKGGKMSHMLRLIVKSSVALVILLFFPMSGLGYVQGDINSDDRIGLEETIFSLKVLSDAATPLSGNTIKVPEDIPTIQQAIDAASDGDTISIAAGTYTESLNIVGKFVILTGPGSGSTVIDAGGADYAIKTIHGAVKVNDLTIQNGVCGIIIADRSYIETHGLIVKNCSNRGLQITQNSNGQIFDSSFNTNGRDGISIQRGSNVLFGGVVNTNGNLDHGLALFEGSTALFDTATYISSNNGIYGIGAHYTSTLYGYATTMTIANNLKGIELSSQSSAGLDTTNITVLDSQDSGIGVYNASALNHKSGTITIQRVTQGSGLNIGDTSNLHSKGDLLITDTYYGGLVVSNASSASIKGKLEVLRSSENGIGLYRSASLASDDTATIKIANSALTGITVADTSTWRASGGNITIQTNTGDAGIGIYRNSTVALRNSGTGLTCLISGNKVGVDLSQSSVFRGEGGLAIQSNTDKGVSSSRNGDIDLRNVSITNNGNTGIKADHDTVLRLENSTVSGNTNGSVQLSFGSSASITGPTLPATDLLCDTTVLSRGDKVCP